MKESLISLGHSFARLQLPEKSVGAPRLEIVQPSYREECVHLPASDVSLYGWGPIRALADALMPLATNAADAKRHRDALMLIACEGEDPERIAQAALYPERAAELAALSSKEPG